MRLAMILVWAFWVSAPAWASGTDLEQNLNGGDVNVGSGDSFALGGSDADINNCRFTEGGLTIQWTRQDKFCQALELIKLGFVETGTLAMCEKTWIGDLYGDLIKCQATLKSKYVALEAEAAGNARRLEEDEQQRAEQMAMQQEYAERFEALEEIANRPAPPPKIIKQTTIQQQPLLSVEQAAALRIDPQ